MPDISCPKCNYVLPAHEAIEGSNVPCPSCGEMIAIPIKPPPPARPAPGQGGGGVFVLGAILLIAVVVAVALFWNGLLKKRDVRPKPEEKKQGQLLVKSAEYRYHLSCIDHAPPVYV